MGIGVILGGFALIIAFVALWLASDTSRRLNSQGQAFIDAHVGRIRSDMSNISKDITQVKRHMSAVQEKVVGMESRNDLDPAALERELAELRQRINSIEAIIPAKARQVQPPQQARM